MVKARCVMARYRGESSALYFFDKRGIVKGFKVLSKPAFNT
jgi:hypothetical protein